MADHSLFVEQQSSRHTYNDFKTGASPRLKTQGYRGPVYNGRLTSFGEIIGSRGLGRGGSRHILNVGTSKNPVYRSFPGATFGRGTGADWVSQFPLPQGRDLQHRKATQVDTVCGIAVVGVEGKNRNRPITYFPIRWKGEQQIQWLTRSELCSVCGKKWVADAFDALFDEWQSKLQYLEEMKQRGLHPDTEQPLTDSDIADMPWLAPGSKSKRQAKENEYTPSDNSSDNTTAHIKVGVGKFGRPKA